MDQMDTIRGTFHPLIQNGKLIRSLPQIDMTFSIRIGSCPMDPMDTIGTALYPDIQHNKLFQSLLQKEHKLSNGIGSSPWNTSISTPIHIYTSGFLIEEKVIRLESGRQYWATLPAISQGVSMRPQSSVGGEDRARNHR